MNLNSLRRWELQRTLLGGNYYNIGGWGFSPPISKHSSILIRTSTYPPLEVVPCELDQGLHSQHLNRDARFRNWMLFGSFDANIEHRRRSTHICSAFEATNARH